MSRDDVRTLARRRAISLATTLGHREVQPAHVLLLALSDPPTADVLGRAGVEVGALVAAVQSHLSTLPTGDGPPEPTAAFEEMFEVAGRIAARVGRPPLHIDLVLAIARVADSTLRRLLDRHGFDAEMVILQLLRGGGGGVVREQNPLPSWCEDPVLELRRTPTPRPCPRPGPWAELRRALACRFLRHVALVGRPGSGRSTLLELLAHETASTPPDSEFGRLVLRRVDLNALVLGLRTRVQPDDALRNWLADLARVAGSGLEPVIVLDDPRLFAAHSHVDDLAFALIETMRRSAERHGMRLLLSLADTDWDRLAAAEPGFAGRFRLVRLDDEDDEAVRSVLEHCASRIAERHGVALAPATVDAALRLVRRFPGRRGLPGAGVDLLDETAAAVRLEGRPQVEADDVRRRVAERAGVPFAASTDSLRERLATVERTMRARVFGQDEALETVLRTVRVAEADISPADRPRGSFLFVGPTGVGKTELARALADATGARLAVFDMSEYGEEHAVAKLLGPPPGYVGFRDTPPRLVQCVIDDPHAVVLLDEIEKAHPRIWNVLLQVLDSGRLTASDGRTGDYRRAWVIATSNLGAGAQERDLGFVRTSADRRADFLQALKVMPPELRARFDATVVFEPLSASTVARIADRFVEEVAARLRERGLELRLDPAVRARVEAEGFVPAEGARPMRRAVDRLVRTPAAEAVIDADGRPGIVRIVPGAGDVPRGIFEPAAADAADAPQPAGRCARA